MRKKGFEIFMLNIEKWTQDNFHNIDTNIKKCLGRCFIFHKYWSLINKLKKLKTSQRVLIVKKLVF